MNNRPLIVSESNLLLRYQQAVRDIVAYASGAAPCVISCSEVGRILRSYHLPGNSLHNPEATRLGLYGPEKPSLTIEQAADTARHAPSGRTFFAGGEDADSHPEPRQSGRNRL